MFSPPPAQRYLDRENLRMIKQNDEWDESRPIRRAVLGTADRRNRNTEAPTYEEL